MKFTLFTLVNLKWLWDKTEWRMYHQNAIYINIITLFGKKISDDITVFKNKQKAFIV